MFAIKESRNGNEIHRRVSLRCGAVRIATTSGLTTPPKIRTAIQASDEPAWIVAERYGISEQTVWKWRKRDSVQDRSHTAHRLQTTLTPAQEAVTVALRKTLFVSLDDLLAVVREFLNPDVSRSGLDRCPRRHGVDNLRDLKAKGAAPSTATPLVTRPKLASSFS
jgi:transposase-like protein